MGGKSPKGYAQGHSTDNVQNSECSKEVWIKGYKNRPFTKIYLQGQLSGILNNVAILSNNYFQRTLFFKKNVQSKNRKKQQQHNQKKKKNISQLRRKEHIAMQSLARKLSLHSSFMFP